MENVREWVEKSSSRCPDWKKYAEKDIFKK
jgi:hypothetical protein